MSAPALAQLTAPAAPALGGEPNPLAAGWNTIPSTRIDLAPTPLDRQPSAYVQAAWRERQHGAITSVEVRFAVAGTTLHARLDWAAADPRPAITDNDIFPDACALLFPANGASAPLETMGSAAAPVSAWHWRAGAASAFLATATGLGTVERAKSHALHAEAAWENGRWSVAFACPLSGAGFSIPTRREIPVAFAAWSGANSERAGLKSHSPAWSTLRLS